MCRSNRPCRRNVSAFLPRTATNADSRLARLNNWWYDTRPTVNIRLWTGIAALLLIVSAIFRAPILGILAVLIFLAGLLFRVWWDYALTNLTYSRRVSANRAFWGSEVKVDLIAENAKILPATRLDVAESITPTTSIQGHSTNRDADSNMRVFSTMFSLGLYERVVHHYVMECNHRGWHRLGPAKLTVSDPWGMVVRSGRVDTRDGVLVYPRMVPIDQLSVPPRQPLGDFKPATPLVEDPMRMSGVRPYVAGDSPKRIHWRATARTGEMQTRTYEPSATPIAAIFLDTRTFANISIGQSVGALEYLIVLTASLSRSLLETRQQVGLYINAPIEGQKNPIRIAPGRRQGQLTRILEQLAQVRPLYNDEIQGMIAHELVRLPWGASIVVVTTRFDAHAQFSFLKLARKAGANRFLFICVGDRPTLLPEAARRFTVFHADGKEAWDAIDHISLDRIA